MIYTIILSILISISSGGTANSRIDDFFNLPFKQRNGLIFIQGEINGVKGNFILDSGASGTVLNKNVTHLLERIDDKTVSAQGINGSTQISTYQVKVLNCGPWKLKDVNLPAMDLSHIEQKVNEEFVGLIGFDMLKDLEIGFDYKAGLLRINVSDGIQDIKTQQPDLLFSSNYKSQEHIPVIVMDINGKNYRMGIDCGAAANLLEVSEYDSLSDWCIKKKNDVLIGATQEKKSTFNCQLKGCTIGPLSFKPMKTIFSEGVITSLKSSNIHIDGILGYEFLKQYYTIINFKANNIKFYTR